MVYCQQEPGRRPLVDVLAAGEMPSLLVSSRAWDQGLCYVDARPRLEFAIGSTMGLCLLLAGDADLERHFAV